MLREMGIRLWPSPSGVVDVADAVPVDLASRASSDVAVVERPIVVASPLARVTVQRGAAVAVGASFEEFSAEVSACAACRLCEGRRTVVFGAGSSSAHWMVVGDAPGELEDESGLPFAGKPGQLLDNMLHAAGLSRAVTGGAALAPASASKSAPDLSPAKQVFVTNALKCKPAGNSNPTPEELAACEPHLKRQVELIKPRIVLAMGRYAVQSLLHSNEPLGKLRGRVHKVHWAPEVSVVVTYHPAFLLRNGEDKARAWDDLCLALEALRGQGAA
jgi:uracil-DNA glycosylase